VLFHNHRWHTGNKAEAKAVLEKALKDFPKNGKLKKE